MSRGTAAGSFCRRKPCKSRNKSPCRPRFEIEQSGRPRSRCSARVWRETTRVRTNASRVRIALRNSIGPASGFRWQRFWFLGQVRKLFHGDTDAGAQFFQRECVPQAFENLPVEIAPQAEFLKLPLKQALLVSRAGHLHGLEAVTGWRVDRDVVVGVQESGPKGDRGNVAFGRGPQAQNEAQ